MAYVATPSDRESFKRCRRAWDLGSPHRRDYEPGEPSTSGALDRAVRDALAVWYFPGMWEWDRAIVRPLALAGFDQSIDHHSAGPGVGAERAVGRRLVERYFDWAPTVDEFTPVRVETDFRVRIPDPRRPGRDLAEPGGQAIEYEGRIDMLVVDGDGTHWMVQHRTVADEWAALQDLLLEERTTSFCWAWEQFFLGVRIAGVVYNELRTVPGIDVALAPETARLETPFARRTQVPRSRDELAAAGVRLADEALEMADPRTRVYPSPSPESCASCTFSAPCLAIHAGHDIDQAMATSFRRRGPEELQERRLGGITWSMGRGAAPQRFGRDRRRRG